MHDRPTVAPALAYSVVTFPLEQLRRGIFSMAALLTFHQSGAAVDFSDREMTGTATDTLQWGHHES